MQCCVNFCKSTQENVPKSGEEGKSISFHRFPSEANLRAAWLRGLDKQDSTLPDSAVVCSQHFLTDDIYETECGSRQIHTGAIPSTVQVCMICLDTDSKLFLMSKHKLEEAYVQLTGHPPYDQGTLRQTLCVQCAQRLTNFSKFRDRSLRARALMMDLVEQHDLITKQHIQTIDRTTHQLNNNMVFTTLGPDHCDLHIQDKQTDTETTIHSVIVKTEGGYDSTEVDEDMEAMKCEEFNIEIVMDPLKYESAPHQCTLCFEEFVDEHEYIEHMRLHPQNDAGVGDHCPSQVRPHTAVNCRSHSTRSSDNKAKQNQEPHTFADPPHTLVAPLFASLATNTKNKSRATEEGNAVRKRKQALDIKNGGQSIHGENPFTCDICRHMFKRRSYLMVHMRTHTGDKPFSCEKCAYKCVQKSSLMTHMRTHTGEKPFSCELCSSKFARKSNLLSHMRIHTGEKPYSCNLCEYKCSLKLSLVSHMRTHTGEKPYSCNLCEYKCSVNSSLVSHMRTHTGEKPYSCNLCEYKCSLNNNLVQHMRTHTGEKPYSCNLCDYQCSLNSNLLKHMRTHTGEKPYSCKLCEYKCSFNCILMKHMRTHTGEKPFSCKFCEYKCAVKSNLVSHMRTHTGDKP